MISSIELGGRRGRNLATAHGPEPSGLPDAGLPNQGSNKVLILIHSLLRVSLYAMLYTIAASEDDRDR